MSNVPVDNWVDNEGDYNPMMKISYGDDNDDYEDEDEDDDDDDETLSERCGTDVQLLWSQCQPSSQPESRAAAKKAQLFICTMSQKCQAMAMAVAVKKEKEQRIPWPEASLALRQKRKAKSGAIMTSPDTWSERVAQP